MTRAAGVALALVLATACGGGDAKPAASSPAATPTASPTPTLIGEAATVRAAATKLAAACPCAVEMILFTEAGKYRLGLTGTYDPKSGTADLHGTEEDEGMVLRVVGGRTFLNPDTGTWVELDFSALRDKKPASALGSATLADPGIAFAGIAHATVATVSMPRDNVTFYDLEVDRAGFLGAAGPWGDMLGGVLDDRSPSGGVGLDKNGAVAQMSLPIPGDDGTSAHSLILFVKKTGVKHPNVTVPRTVNKVDVATFKG